MVQPKQNTIISPFHGEHDHTDCQTEALKSAVEQCREKGLKLTTIRKQVLEIVWASHNPIGAYDVLQALEQRGHKPAPPTAYRALDFLVKAKLIHRIESLNAFIGCPLPQAPHQCQFYICQECGHIAEVNNPDIVKALSAGAEELGFESQEPIIEVHGVCKDCQK